MLISNGNFSQKWVSDVIDFANLNRFRVTLLKILSFIHPVSYFFISDIKETLARY